MLHFSFFLDTTVLFNGIIRRLNLFGSLINIVHEIINFTLEEETNDVNKLLDLTINYLFLTKNVNYIIIICRNCGHYQRTQSPQAVLRSKHVMCKFGE